MKRTKGGKDAEACFGSFPNGRPVRFRSRPSSLHSQQGAATSSRVCLRPGVVGTYLSIIERKQGTRTLNVLCFALQPKSCPDACFDDNRSFAHDSLEPENHQHVVDILIADLERMRLDPVAFKSKGFIEPLRRQFGRSNQGNLLDPVDLPRPVDNLFHQRAANTFAARFRTHVNAPDMAFMALFVVRVAIKTRSARKDAGLKISHDKVDSRIAGRKFLPEGGEGDG